MKRILLYIAVFVLITIAAVNVPIFERFTITDEKSGNVVFQDRVEKLKEFYVSFTHSVNRTPVREYYRISGNKLILERAVFYSYGAGMPELSEYGSSEARIENGVVRLDNINKEFKKFTYFAGTYANHSLNYNETEVLFSQFVKPQTPVTFEVKKISLITLVKSIHRD